MVRSHGTNRTNRTGTTVVLVHTSIPAGTTSIILSDLAYHYSFRSRVLLLFQISRIIFLSDLAYHYSVRSHVSLFILCIALALNSLHRSNSQCYNRVHVPRVHLPRGLVSVTPFHRRSGKVSSIAERLSRNPCCCYFGLQPYRQGPLGA